MRIKTIFVSVATVGLMVGPALAHGVLGSVAGAKAECTIKGTAADDNLNGTTREDVICTGAGSDTAFGLEGNDVIRLGQGDDIGGGGDGNDVVRGQADDDEVCGNGQNDRLIGGQGADNLGSNSAVLSNACLDNQLEPGNDWLKSRDHVSNNDRVDGGQQTDTCVIDSNDYNANCEH